MKTERARARSWGRNRSPMSELEVGAHAASPTPTASRAANIEAKLLQSPEA